MILINPSLNSSLISLELYPYSFKIVSIIKSLDLVNVLSLALPITGLNFCCLLLFIEWLFIFKNSGEQKCDCYLLLLPTSFLIFNYIKSIRIKIKYSKTLRSFSSFSYPLHGTVARIANTFLTIIISNQLIIGILNFLLTSIFVLLSFIIVKKLEKKLKVLKYSY